MTILPLLLVTLSAHADPLNGSYAAAEAAVVRPACGVVQEVTVEQPSLKEGVYFLGFSLKMYGGDYAAWKAVRDVKTYGDKPGTLDATVPAADWVSIFTAADSADVWALKSHYGGAGDETILNVKCTDGRVNKVTVSADAAPAAFKSLIERMRAVAAKLFWVS